MAFDMTNDLGKMEVSSEKIEHADIDEAPSFTQEEEKALVRKIDMTLLPTMWIMYLLSYMDRTKYVHILSMILSTLNSRDELTSSLPALGMQRFLAWRRI